MASQGGGAVGGTSDFQYSDHRANCGRIDRFFGLAR